MVGSRGGVEPAFTPMLAAASIESVEPGWSGLSAGLMIGTFLAVAAMGVVAATGAIGGSSGLAAAFTANLWAWVGGIVGVVLVCGVAGFFIGRAID
jgi:hypothetical protein